MGPGEKSRETVPLICAMLIMKIGYLLYIVQKRNLLKKILVKFVKF